MTVQAIIFLGPSLKIEKAKSILPEVEYKPPVKKGDLLKLSSSLKEETIIGIIDGYFLLDYPPPPIEVYHILTKKWVKVIGGASLGALRAVELEKFGMVGIGNIFHLYKSKKIIADDEVAVTFTSDNILQSEAMIDIRYNVMRAFKRSIISKDAKKDIIKISKNTYFPYRRYQDIIEKAKLNDQSKKQEFDAFDSFIRSSALSLKEIDAIVTLNFIKKELQNLQIK